MEEIDSQVFGKVSLLDEDEEEFDKLKSMIHKYPVNSFSILNKILNELGFSHL